MTIAVDWDVKPQIKQTKISFDKLENNQSGYLSYLELYRELFIVTCLYSIKTIFDLTYIILCFLTSFTILWSSVTSQINCIVACWPDTNVHVAYLTVCVLISSS